MIAVESHSEGAVLLVRASAGSRTSGLRGEQSGALKVSVTQVAERGKANKAVIELLAGALGLRKSQFEILSGETSPQKRVLVREIGAAELKLRLSALIPADS